MTSEKRAEMLHDLELRHCNAIHKCDIVERDEETRRLKLHLILLRDEVAVLKDQITSQDNHIRLLTKQRDLSRHYLALGTRKWRQHTKLLWSRDCELRDLKEELESLNHVTRDSSKKLSDKLALTRELNALRPEVEHLRSQLARHQDTLAQKLSLERQVTALEVEVANETRSADMARERQGQERDKAESLWRQLDELQKRLENGKSVANTCQCDRTAQAGKDNWELREQLSAANNELAALKNSSAQMIASSQSKSSDLVEELRRVQARLTSAEQRIQDRTEPAQPPTTSPDHQDGAIQTEMDNLREKCEQVDQALSLERQEKERIQQESKRLDDQLHSQEKQNNERIEKMKAKLREAEDELERCRAALKRTQIQTTTVPLKAAANPARKNKAVNKTTENSLLLQTPDRCEDMPKRPLKKWGLDHSMVGEKSNFSVTPFLNKTSTLVEDSNLSRTKADEIGSTMLATPVQPCLDYEGRPLLDALKTHEIADDGQDQQQTLDDPADSNKGLAIPKPSRATAKKAADSDTAPKFKKRPPNATENPGESSSLKNTMPPLSNRATITLESVSEEVENSMIGHDNAVAQGPGVAINAKAKKQAHNAPSADTAKPKKKRKLLGANSKSLTAHDDDEEADFHDKDDEDKDDDGGNGAGKLKSTAKRPIKVPMGAVKKLGRVSELKGRALGARLGAPKSFSPLKRDRRGAHASFLADNGT